MLQQFDKESSAKKRSLILKKLESEILAEVAFIPIYHRKEAAVIPNNLIGLTYLSKGTGFSFPENWSFK